MAKKKPREKRDEELSPEELEAQEAESLPDREAMSLIIPPPGADGMARIAPDPPGGPPESP
ncbi:MAG: hypothetical protein E6G36_12200 [Actinobacteria bacterium]|nr:MAG: hypothetical protein E6G36_12200 [Actinomycetota bacterium]